VLFVQYSSYKNNFESVRKNQDWQDLFTWLKINGDKDCVVLAPRDIGEMIPAFTQCNVVEQGYGLGYMMSAERRAYTNDFALNELSSGHKSSFRLDYLICGDCRAMEYRLRQNISRSYTSNRYSIYTIKK
jgi:hypothetical protein